MAKERNDCVYAVHIIICTIILIAAAILLGVSINSVVRGDDALFNLNYTSESFLNTVFNLGIVGIIVAGALIVLSLVGLIASAKGCCGVFFKILYVIFGGLAVVALIGVAVVTLWFATDSNPRQIREFFEDAWIRTVNSDITRNEACAIQVNYECQGFNIGDCDSCTGNSCGNSDRCPSGCEGVTYSAGVQGCWDAVHDGLQRFYLPVGIVSASLAGLTFVDLFLVCFV